MAMDKREWLQAKYDREKPELRRLGSQIYRAVERTGLDKMIELKDIKLLYRASGDGPDYSFSRRVAIAATILANEKWRKYYAYERASAEGLRRLFDEENGRATAEWMNSFERRDYISDVITGAVQFPANSEGASK